MAKKRDEKPGAPKTVREAASMPSVRPSSDALVDHFFALQGGPAKVAKLLHDEYHSAKAGSMVRQRILEVVLRSLRSTEGKGLGEDLGPLTNEDLDRLIDNREKAIEASLTPGATNAHPGPVADRGPGGGPPAPDAQAPPA